MRKLFFIIATIVAMSLVSCDKEVAEPIKKNKAYTFTEYTGGYNKLVNEAPSGTEIEYTYFINEYTQDGIRVAMNAIEKPQVGKQYKFNASQDTYYVTVKFQYGLKLGSKEVSEVRYLTNAFLLKEGQTTQIYVDDNTYFQKTEPK